MLNIDSIANGQLLVDSKNYATGRFTPFAEELTAEIKSELVTSMPQIAATMDQTVEQLEGNMPLAEALLRAIMVQLGAYAYQLGAAHTFVRQLGLQPDVTAEPTLALWLITSESLIKGNDLEGIPLYGVSEEGKELVIESYRTMTSIVFCHLNEDRPNRVVPFLKDAEQAYAADQSQGDLPEA